MTSGPVDEVNIAQTSVFVKPKKQFFFEKNNFKTDVGSCLVNNADAVQKVEPLHEIRRCEFSVQQLLIQADDVGSLICVFIQQFQAEVVEAAAAHAVGIACGGLGTSVEKGIAAAFIAAQVVHGVCAVHDADFVVVTGLAAVLEAVPP